MSYYTQRMSFSQQNGFTLIELVMVILLIGILSVMVVPNWTASTLGIEFESRHILDDIRYAQSMSLATGQRYRFVKVSSTTYGIYNEAGAAVTMPNGATTITLTNGVSISSMSNLPSSLVAFDSLGAPYTTSSIPGTALASTAVISLTNGTQSATVSITPSTGYGVVQCPVPGSPAPLLVAQPPLCRH